MPFEAGGKKTLNSAALSYDYEEKIEQLELLASLSAVQMLSLESIIG
jgi:hypothetical protein